jgi:hypothetical protein
VEEKMGTEKDRKRRRRQRRRKKLHKLKKKLEKADRLEEREFLVEKIRRISLNPKQDIPEKYHSFLEIS